MRRSPTDVRAILDVVARNAVRVCEAEDATLLMRQGEILAPMAHFGRLPSTVTQLGIARDSVSGRALLDRRTVHVPDLVRVASEYPAVALPGPRDGVRALVSTPLLRGEEALGVITLRRQDPVAFSAHQLEALETFADQAAIAIENVRLFTETKEALEQRTALADILELISRSAFDVAPVLEAVIAKAVALSGADNGTFMVRDGDAFRRAAHAGVIPDPVAYRALSATLLRPGRESILGRVLLERRSVQIPDIEADPEYSAHGLGTLAATRAVTGDVRAMLGVPLTREDVIVGVIVLRRFTPGAFPSDAVALIETFAAQAGIAIENVRLFNEIQDKSSQLAAASQHKSAFLANMSHELRTPLNAIIGFTDVLRSEMFGAVNEKQREYLGDVLSSGRHLLSLINDILDLSKVEAGRMELELSEFSLEALIDEAVTLVRERAGQHGIELAREVDGVDVVLADERKMKQVLLNLLSNAVKFTPDGGWVGVTARRYDGEVEISVRDSGVGIAPEDLPKVFEEFRQVGAASAKAEGTGLGLTLTRRLVELHGGRIWVESELGKGTTFAFRVPLRESVAEARASSGSAL